MAVVVIVVVTGEVVVVVESKDIIKIIMYIQLDKTEKLFQFMIQLYIFCNTLRTKPKVPLKYSAYNNVCTL